MRIARGTWLAAAALALSGLPAPAQTPPPAGVAATVNGQPITEAALHRLLDRVSPDKQAEARPDLLDELVDQLLLDQYLLQMNVAVDKAEVDKQIDQLRAALIKQKQTLEGKLKEIGWTEAELREQVVAQLRWEKYADGLANEKALRELFDANKEMFDGTLVHARHILMIPPSNDAQTAAATVAQLQAIKKDVEAKVAAGLTRLPPNSDKLTVEKERMRLMDDAFADAARTHSACPSKQHGGDVDWFPRAGHMVEPFAKAAFSLPPYTISEVIKTQFGYHLILPLEKRPGVEIKFEQVKDSVKGVYTDRMRESILAQVRAKSQIVITPAPPTPAPTPAPVAPVTPIVPTPAPVVPAAPAAPTAPGVKH
jgi:parvulin-like peptidyl-prolyl isomerase